MKSTHSHLHFKVTNSFSIENEKRNTIHKIDIESSIQKAQMPFWWLKCVHNEMRKFSTKTYSFWPENSTWKKVTTKKKQIRLIFKEPNCSNWMFYRIKCVLIAGVCVCVRMKCRRGGVANEAHVAKFQMQTRYWCFYFFFLHKGHGHQFFFSSSSPFFWKHFWWVDSCAKVKRNMLYNNRCDSEIESSSLKHSDSWISKTRSNETHRRTKKNYVEKNHRVYWIYFE